MSNDAFPGSLPQFWSSASRLTGSYAVGALRRFMPEAEQSRGWSKHEKRWRHPRRVTMSRSPRCWFLPDSSVLFPKLEWLDIGPICDMIWLYDHITYETKGMSITVNLLTSSSKSYCDAFNRWCLLRHVVITNQSTQFLSSHTWFERWTLRSYLTSKRDLVALLLCA